jgi:hypothetical protein
LEVSFFQPTAITTTVIQFTLQLATLFAGSSYQCSNMSSDSYSIHNFNNEAWILNDDDWNRVWVDDALPNSQLSCLGHNVDSSNGTSSTKRSHRSKKYDVSSEPIMKTTAKWRENDSSDKHRKKTFGKKRRPSLAAGATKRKPNSDDDDNNTISTTSTCSMIYDDRDATAWLLSFDELHRTPNEDARHLDENQDDVEELDRVVKQFIHRCNITIIQNPSSSLNDDEEPLPDAPLATTTPSQGSTTTFAPPKIRKNHKVKSSMSRRELSSSKKGKRPKDNHTTKKKSVSFHQYDTVVNSSNQTEYIYSLYYNETEYEKEQDYDVVDDLESAVNDVGYFFQCLQQSISEDVKLRFEEQQQQQQRRRQHQNQQRRHRENYKNQINKPTIHSHSTNKIVQDSKR